MDEILIEKVVIYESELRSFLQYAEDDEILTEHYGEPTISFPNVVHHMSKKELEKLLKLIG